jgi:plastocyanin
MHNVQVTAPDGSKPFQGSLLTGPASVTYNVPALAAGAYTFSCVVHPTMTGTLTVK